MNRARRPIAGSRDPFRRVRLVVFDFDGVFTDNGVYVFEDGREAVRCSRGDGYGILLLKTAGGVEAMVLSLETNPVVAARCRKLGIACVQGCRDKGTAIDRLMKEKGLTPDEVAFVGNDANDIPCLRRVGLPIIVRDAHPSTFPHARVRTRAPGGRGAVREVCDRLLAARGTGPAARGGRAKNTR